MDPNDPIVRGFHVRSPEYGVGLKYTHAQVALSGGTLPKLDDLRRDSSLNHSLTHDDFYFSVCFHF